MKKERTSGGQKGGQREDGGERRDVALKYETCGSLNEGRRRFLKDTSESYSWV